jgi:branched-chain amino acid transport system ATP-binding protein
MESVFVVSVIVLGGMGSIPGAIVGALIIQVPEGRRIFSRMTVLENLEMGAFLRKDSTAIKEDLDHVFELFPRLKERVSQKGGTLSGGEQQMLAMARGLMASPKLMMLDEPSMGLAPVVVETIFEIIAKLDRDGITILLVEQNANLALSIADRGYVLETGEIKLTGTGKDLLANEAVRKAYLGES